MSSAFSADWLSLREPFDAAARSPDLAARLAQAVCVTAVPHGCVRLIDLGAGTGALLRWLAPRLPFNQEWLLVESDPVLCRAARHQLTAWAKAAGFAVTQGMGIAQAITQEAEPRRSLLIFTRAEGPPPHQIRIKIWLCDLAHPAPEGIDAVPLHMAHGVFCSALLDLVSEAWLARMIGLCTATHIPIYVGLTVDGRCHWRPRLPEDARIGALFRRHMRGDKGFGPALGVAAVGAAVLLFRDCSYSCEVATADWLIAPTATAMLEAMIKGYAAAARAMLARSRVPQDAGALPAIAVWEEARRAQCAAGALALCVGHTDLLAIPGAANDR